MRHKDGYERFTCLTGVSSGWPCAYTHMEQSGDVLLPRRLYNLMLNVWETSYCRKQTEGGHVDGRRDWQSRLRHHQRRCAAALRRSRSGEASRSDSWLVPDGRAVQVSARRITRPLSADRPGYAWPWSIRETRLWIQNCATL